MKKVYIVYAKDTRTGDRHLHSVHNWYDDNDKNIRDYVLGLYHAFDDKDPYVEFEYETWHARG